MGTLYLHRVKPVEEDGTLKLEKVPEKKKQENFGVTYRVAIDLIDTTHANVYGWDTGYPAFDPSDGGARGSVYAPEGFFKGKLAFVSIKDEMLSASKMDNTTIDKFLKNIRNSDLEGIMEMMQGYSLVGEIEYDYR